MTDNGLQSCSSKLKHHIVGSIEEFSKYKDGRLSQGKKSLKIKE